MAKAKEVEEAIEKENASLRDVLPKVYARGNLDPTSLGALIDLISNIAFADAKARSADILGHVFEYFLGEFALAEGLLELKYPETKNHPLQAYKSKDT